MNLPATTTVAQQYPTSTGFISTFKFYNIILFLFPTCNFNLKISLFYYYFSFSEPLFSLFFFVFVFLLFFSTPFLLRAALCSFLSLVAPFYQFFPPLVSNSNSPLFIFILIPILSLLLFFGLYWIQHKNWFYKLIPMH